MDAQVRKMFYVMYPDSDPKYYGYFGFGRNAFANADGSEKLLSISVYYKHGLEYADHVEVIKGKNDRDPRWAHYLHSYNFPRIWRTPGSISPHNGRVSLGYPINNFRMYVNEREYFMSKLPHIAESWSNGKTINEQTIYDIRKAPFNYKKEPYFAMIAGAYIASCLSGISLLHLKEDNGTPKIVNSIIRYHFYYQIRKFMKNPTLIDRYSVSDVRGHIPTKTIDADSKGTDGDGNHFVFDAHIEYSNIDYLSFISSKSSGLTRIGQKLLQESIESYVYSVLGSQAKTRWSIVNKGAKSSQTQDVFRKIVEDTITQSDPTIMISNMRRAIHDCNVILNMAISPGVVLAPSSMVILEKPIPGYNNVLTIGTSSMLFGVNSKVNFTSVKKDPPKKVHQPDKPGTHLDSLDNTIGKAHQSATEKSKTTDDKEKGKSKTTKAHQSATTDDKEDSHDTELLILLGVSAVSTFVIVKYVV